MEGRDAQVHAEGEDAEGIEARDEQRSDGADESDIGGFASVRLKEEQRTERERHAERHAASITHKDTVAGGFLVGIIEEERNDDTQEGKDTQGIGVLTKDDEPRTVVD